jgi:hypothetical protein
MKLSFATMVVALAAGTGACADATTQLRAQEAVLRVDSDPGVPLANAAVSYDGKLLTRTASDGGARLRVTGREGDVFRVGVACPAGYEAVTPVELDVVVRRDETGRLPEFAVRCARTLRRAVVAVRATNGPRLPILHLGREVGRTDASGAATLALDVQPGTDVELVLDTHAEKRIHPASPTLSFKAPSTDDLVLLDQKFIVDRPRLVRAVVRGPQLARPLGG